jgi:hypothetical protein
MCRPPRPKIPHWQIMGLKNKFLAQMRQASPWEEISHTIGQLEALGIFLDSDDQPRDKNGRTGIHLLVTSSR